jgi:hypothetical protein
LSGDVLNDPASPFLPMWKMHWHYFAPTTFDKFKPILVQQNNCFKIIKQLSLNFTWG